MDKVKNPMVLAFDCSTQACSVAVVIDGVTRARKIMAATRGQAEILMPMIVDTLAEARIAWADIDLIGVTIGPGSFTGLRIGLAVARGLAVATGRPVAGVPTTLVVAHSVPPAERVGRTVLALIDGKRDDLFVQSFSGDLTPLSDIKALRPDMISQSFPGALVLAGDGSSAFPESERATYATASSYPDVEILAALAEQSWREGRALPPRPIYIRPPDVTLPSGVAL